MDKDSKYGYCRTKLTEATAEWLIAEYADETGFVLHRSKITKVSGMGRKSSSRKYVCGGGCGTIIRASKEVNVICGDCGVAFEEES